MMNDIPSTKQQQVNRLFIDALRNVFGMLPLYRRQIAHQKTWNDIQYSIIVSTRLAWGTNDGLKRKLYYEVSDDLISPSN
ncbi:MAG TPA: hypothetical protein VJ201_03655 [Candidatus Babeliales bacterium]|nr:hypothetical protein [Candidatus Babeliales bacterium]